MIRGKPKEQPDQNYQKEVSDEEILNVFRRANRPFRKTGDVVKELTIGERAVQKRLKKLEEEGRVEGESVGSAIIWWLDGDEPEDEVWEDEAKYYRWSNRARSLAYTSFGIGFWCFAFAGVLILAAIGVDTFSPPLFPLSAQHLFMGVALMVYFGGLGVVFWGGLRCIAYILEYTGDHISG